jgi:hypothetical protein
LTVSSLINTLAQIATSGARSQSQFQLQLIGAQMTAQLNRKIAELKAAANDPILPALQHQAATLNAQKTRYDAAQRQLVANGSPIGDLDTQLSTMATAAAAGDGATFDQALAQAQTDLGNLKVVPLLPGLQPDGAASLKSNGLGIQSSATYDLSTPAGQAQAAADISAAQGLMAQLSTMTAQNTQIANSVSQALEVQITSLNDQVNAREQTDTGDAATQIQKLQKQTQTQFHLIELSLGSAGNTSTMLQDFETAQAATSAATGTILDVLDTQLSSSGSSPTSNSSSTANSSSSKSSTFSTHA